MMMTERKSYKQLVISLKNASARESISRAALKQLVIDLVHAFNDLKKQAESSQECQSVLVLLECLRNCCISCQHNQIFLVQETSAIDTTLTILQDDFIINCTEDNTDLTKVKKCSLQFLGNLVAGNKTCQEVMRHRILPAVALELLEVLPWKLRDILCMIIYNCVHERSEVWDSNESKKLFTRIVNFVSNSESEWGLLIVQCFLKEDKFSDIYNHLDCCQIERLGLLNLVEAYLNDESCIIPESTITFVSDVYKETCRSLRAVESTKETAIEEHEKLSRALLKTLCAVAGAQNYVQIRNDINLLDLVVSQLHELSACAKNREENQPAGLFTRDSELGLKRDLIRLIGNLCYKNKKFQDRVRELNGIPAILDNCRIDDKNPYISQWSVFAIRNLCDDNVENQRIISKFDEKGVIDVTSAEQLGIDLRVVNGKVRIHTTTKKQ